MSTFENEPNATEPVASAPARARHQPVLVNEVLSFLSPAPGEFFVDCTVGLGGHSRLLAQRLGPTGRLIGLDQDAAMLDEARANTTGLQEAAPLTLLQANFEQLRELLDNLKIDHVDGVLADLGFCSAQLDDPERGLSFQLDGPLDMRLDPGRGESAAGLLKRLNERDLADVIYQLGEERFSRRIARKIVEARKTTPINTTTELAELVRRCVPRSRPKGRGPGIDPATRTFQALRIAVNDELGALDRLLAALPSCVRSGGRVVLISFHSLEDRRVKQSFKSNDSWDVVTRKPVQATDEEIAHNPRARSAKLRAAKRR